MGSKSIDIGKTKLRDVLRHQVAVALLGLRARREAILYIGDDIFFLLLRRRRGKILLSRRRRSPIRIQMIDAPGSRRIPSFPFRPRYALQAHYDKLFEQLISRRGSFHSPSHPKSRKWIRYLYLRCADDRCPSFFALSSFNCVVVRGCNPSTFPQTKSPRGLAALSRFGKRKPSNGVLSNTKRGSPCLNAEPIIVSPPFPVL